MTTRLPATPAAGTPRTVTDGTGAVRLEDVYGTDIHDLWSALTDPSRLACWIADVVGEWRPGGQFHARFMGGWARPGRIEVCEAPHSLAVTMFPGGLAETVIDATRVAERDRTRLVIEERGIPLGQVAIRGARWQANVADLAIHLTTARRALIGPGRSGGPGGAPGAERDEDGRGQDEVEVGQSEGGKAWVWGPRVYLSHDLGGVDEDES
jgi:uncharacterized protein YndB with AHSA1/START domain